MISSLFDEAPEVPESAPADPAPAREVTAILYFPEKVVECGTPAGAVAALHRHRDHALKVLQSCRRRGEDDRYASRVLAFYDAQLAERVGVAVETTCAGAAPDPAPVKAPKAKPSPRQVLAILKEPRTLLYLGFLRVELAPGKYPIGGESIHGVCLSVSMGDGETGGHWVARDRVEVVEP